MSKENIIGSSIAKEFRKDNVGQDGEKAADNRKTGNAEIKGTFFLPFHTAENDDGSSSHDKNETDTLVDTDSFAQQRNTEAERN